jgi:hypothetical protein
MAGTANGFARKYLKPNQRLQNNDPASCLCVILRVRGNCQEAGNHRDEKER